MTTTDLARVSALLDEAKDLITQVNGLVANSWPEPAARAYRKVEEAQQVLLGDKPTRAEDN